MALIFPFDTSLIGYQEVVNLNTSDLPIPLFTFPKGSFFVDNTYAVIKGTNNILRPGIDYLVLSCNETIPFSNIPAQDTLLKQAYVRNAILLKDLGQVELEWHVAYCGGEDEFKPAEYENYISNLYNAARTSGTTNLLLTMHQAWGGFLSKDNTQIMAGKFIYSKPFREVEEFQTGGGYGWGKVELAVQAIAESMTQGGDEGIINAFFNWVKHNEIEFNKLKTTATLDLNTKIADLGRKRVDYQQFVFKDESDLPNGMNFVEHNNIMLRGIDPNKPTTLTSNPVFPNRSDIGFFGLAESGFDVGLPAVKLFQRTEQPVTRVRYGVTFNKEIYNAGVIQCNIVKDIGTPANKQYTLYVVSKKQGVIHTRDVTAILMNAYNTRVPLTFNYNAGVADYTLDNIFAYILDSNMGGDFAYVGNAKVVIDDFKYVFSLEAINRGNLLGSDATEVIDQVTPKLELIVKRSYGLNSVPAVIEAKLGSNGVITKINNANSINTTFATGELEKRLYIELTNPPASGDTVVFNLKVNNGIMATMLFGLKSTGVQDFAYITLLDKNDQVVNVVDVNNTYKLKVQFSKDADYFISDLALQASRLLGLTSTVKLGTKEVVNNSTLIYPISFNGSLNEVVSVSLTNPNNAAFKTNQLNVMLGGNSVNPTAPVFEAIVLGRNLKLKRDSNNYILDFAIEINNHIDGGYVFDLTSSHPDLVLPNSVITNNGVVRFSGTIPVSKLESGTIFLKFTRAGANFNLGFTLEIDKLLLIEIEYRDGGFSNKALELGRAFRLMLTNPFLDRRLVLSKTNFLPILGITDIVYGSGLTEIVIDSLTLQPGERKQITVGDWVSIEDIKSDLTDITRYAPNLTISQAMVSTGSIVKSGSYLSELGEMLINNEHYKVQAINVLTGGAIYDQGMVDNYIDVVTQFDVAINNIHHAVIDVSSGFTVTLRNTIISPVDQTVILSLTVRRVEDIVIDTDNVTLSINFVDINGQSLHKVITSITGK